MKSFVVLSIKMTPISYLGEIRKSALRIVLLSRAMHKLGSCPESNYFPNKRNRSVVYWIVGLSMSICQYIYKVMYFHTMVMN